MTATTARTTTKSFLIKSLVPGAATHYRVDSRHATASGARRFLDARVVDEGAPVIEQGAQFRILRGCEVALRLHDEKIGREPHLEPALLRLKACFSQLTGDIRRLV